jgi:hypothetical protein
MVIASFSVCFCAIGCIRGLAFQQHVYAIRYLSFFNHGINVHLDQELHSLAFIIHDGKQEFL